MKVLHIIATPRAHESYTLRVSCAFIERLHERYRDLHVEELNLFQCDLPAVVGDNIEAKYTLMKGAPVDRRHAESWKQIESLIAHFLSADAYLITTPMWNLSIPYVLKYYIDAIIQPGFPFKYNEHGHVVGLVSGRKMIVVSSRGGDYSANSPLHAFDFQEPYLRAIFSFVGISDMQFVNVQPTDVSLELRQFAIHAAIEKVQRLADQCKWGIDRDAPMLESPTPMTPRALVA